MTARLILFVDRSRSMGSAFSKIVLPACARLHATLAPDACSLVLFGDGVEVVRNVASSAFFTSPAMLATELQGQTNLADALHAGVQLAIDDRAKFDAEQEAEILELARRQLEVRQTEIKKERKSENIHVFFWLQSS